MAMLRSSHGMQLGHVGEGRDAEDEGGSKERP
jgi:hypothetical protein